MQEAGQQCPAFLLPSWLVASPAACRSGASILRGGPFSDFFENGEARADADQLPAAEAEINQLLEKEPEHLPAQMARARLLTVRAKAAEAVAAYEGILTFAPDFAPAQKRLAAIYADDPQKINQAHELATRARRTLADDPELTRTLARVSYERKEHKRVIQLLQESARRQPLEAASLFYLGMAQLQERQKAEGRQTLEKALAAGLPEPFAGEARRTLEELDRG